MFKEFNQHYFGVSYGNTYVERHGLLILSIALAIADWYSGKPEELQFSRGTWLAVTEARTDGWYYAVKFDSGMNSLTNEKGYVAQNVVQVYN